MANLIKLHGSRVEIPSRSLQYPLSPPIAKLEEALEAYSALREQPSLNHGSPRQRGEISTFLRQFGQLLFHTLFPGGEFHQLSTGLPLLLETGHDWCGYPWEFLHDGERWIALDQGILRGDGMGGAEIGTAGISTAGEAGFRPRAPSLKVLGIHAYPLLGGNGVSSGQPGGERPGIPRGTATRLSAAEFTANGSAAGGRAGRGARSFSIPMEFPFAGAGGRTPIRYRLVEHATPAVLELEMEKNPDIMLFAGFADEEGWKLESPRMTGATVSWEWIFKAVSQSARAGMRLLVLQDSMGWSKPALAAARTRDLLQCGLQAVIRLEGHLPRERERAYLVTLFDHLAKGASVLEGHLAAIRNASRAGKDDWGWSIPQLHTGGSPSGAGSLPVQAREKETTPHTHPHTAGRTDGNSHQFLSGWMEPHFESTPPAPPVFRGSRRVVGREAERRNLGELLQPDSAMASPLVFLSGPAGSGKSMLALEMARRLQRRFAQVLYLPHRALLPDGGGLIPVEGVEPVEKHPGQPLFAALTRHLLAPEAGNGALSGWKDALLRHCGDGSPRLLILDRLDRFPGYEELLDALQEVPRNSRVLAVSRALPPLAPGARVELGPLPVEALEQLCGEDFPARLEALDPSGALLTLCRNDPQAGFLLSRVRRLPAFPDLRTVLLKAGQVENDHPEQADESGEEVEGATTLPATAIPAPAISATALVALSMGGLSKGALLLLHPLALFPSLVHREIAAAGSGLEEEALQASISELRALGWVESHGGGRYLSLHPRLHGAIAGRVLTRNPLARMRPLLVRAYKEMISEFADVLLGREPGGRANGRGESQRSAEPPLLAWCERASGHHPPWRVERFQRLGVERANLAEMALWLTAEEDWQGLEAIMSESGVLDSVEELSDLSVLLHTCLLAAGEGRGDIMLQARALNRLAVPLLRARQAEKARPILERALELLGESPGWSVLGETYRKLSRCNQMLGRREPALQLLYSATELAQHLELPDDLTLACGELAGLLPEMGEQGASGKDYLERQVRFLRQNGYMAQAATVMRMLASMLVRTGKSEEGLELYRQGLEICRDTNNPRETGATLLGLAEYHARQGDGARALALLGEAGEECGEEALDSEARGRILAGICRLFEQRGQPDLALEGYLRIRKLLEEMGDREALIGVLDRIGGLYYQLGEQAKSTQCYEERLQLQSILIPG